MSNNHGARIAIAAAAGVAVGASLAPLFRRLRAALAPQWKLAFYSTERGSVTTVPELMVVPIDDHMIVRGHAVFDTASLVGGRLYRLDVHLERLLDSAAAARLPLPFADGSRAANKARMASLIAATCRAARAPSAHVRFWLSAGPGNLGVTPEGCRPAFYVLAADRLPLAADPSAGVAEAWVPEDAVPLKPRKLAELKSTNYMLNALTAMAARDRGGRYGLGHTPSGLLRESCVMNVALVGRDRVLRTPDFVQVLAGTTVRRAMELAAASLVRDGVLRGVAQGPLTCADAERAAEVFLLAGDTHVIPVTTLAGNPVGDGAVGPVARALHALLEHDAAHGRTQHHELHDL